jgi:hypothetical protein
MSSTIPVRKTTYSKYLKIGRLPSGAFDCFHLYATVWQRNVLEIVEVEGNLRLTVSQSVCLGIEYPCGTCDQILLPVGILLSEICGPVSMGRSLWQEDGSAICSVITQWSESLRTRNHTLLSLLRLLQRSPSYFITVNQSVCLGIEQPSGTCDQILLPVGMLLSEICGPVSMGRPLWQEDGSAICSVITQWSELLRTRNHTLLSHLRLPQPGGPGSRIYIPQEQGGPVIPQGTGFPLRRLLRLAFHMLKDKIWGICIVVIRYLATAFEDMEYCVLGALWWFVAWVDPWKSFNYRQLRVMGVQ